MANILIIDDDEMLCKTVSRNIKRLGHDVSCAFTIEKGLGEALSGEFDVVFLDVNLPDGNGLDSLPAIAKALSSPEVIIITGEGDPDGAELAIKSGAWAYVEKPLSMKQTELQLVRALQYRSERSDRKPPVHLKREGIIGASPQLEACLDVVARTAGSDVSVLITGDTGTGKELFAKAIHKNGSRADNEFVVVDCAALPETLVEGTLFGHEKGAFTGAEKAREGLIREADGGTLFLDEVGELPLSVQKDFLRVLQEKRFRPLGSSKEIGSDFRLVSATNRSLEAMVKAGKFRKDLFFRLFTEKIELPPLKSRPQDMKDLAFNCMIRLCERYGTETKGFSPEFFDVLAAYDWPGNARELINTMERVFAMARFEPILFPRHLPTHIRVHEARTQVNKRGAQKEKPEKDKTSTDAFIPLQIVRERAISKVEKHYLQDLILHTKSDIKEACRISGLSRSRLYHLLKKHDIVRL